MTSKRSVQNTSEASAGAALSESYPELHLSTVPGGDYQAAFESYRAFDEGLLESVPLALDAYLDYQRDRSAW